MTRLIAVVMCWTSVVSGQEIGIRETAERIVISTPQLEAAISKRGYVTGVTERSFVDKKTGLKEAGYGLDIVDWIMEPGSDEAYRDKLEKEMVYQFNNSYHGKTPKRAIEGPQICRQAKALDPKVIRGKDFVAVRTEWNYRTAAPGKKSGSKWEQTIVFPAGKRYFVSSDKITMVNDSDSAFLRIDMPGHIRHKNGDTFSQVYLSYQGKIPASEFAKDFPPDEKFNYRRANNELPKRFIRAYQLRDAQTGAEGPWLAGMTLRPDVVSEAWCHQRGYVCMIEEFGGRPIKAGQSFSAAFVVGFFDSVEEMERVYDEYAGADEVVVNEGTWRLGIN